MVKSVCETGPENSYSGSPPVYQDLSTRHDWSLAKEASVDLPISLNENSKLTSGNSWNSLQAQSKDLGTASQTSLTGVKLRLGRRLRFRVMSSYNRFTAVVTTWFSMGLPVIRYPLNKGYILAV